MASIPERWANQAQYDLATAHAMFEAGRWLYVVFCCQQSVEKMIKSVIAERSGEAPPRLHNLVRLAEHAGFDLDTATARALRVLTAYYIESRYPDELDSVSQAVTRSLAAEVLESTTEVLNWLNSQKR